MKSSDFVNFAETWAYAWEQVGKTVTSGAIELAFESLRDYELAEIRRALTVHMRDPHRGRFVPTVADVVLVLEQNTKTGWPNPDEAWGICIRTLDEADTVVVTDEIMQAREACRPVMDLGDEVGARMAFREAYSRLVGSAKFSGMKPRWWVSNGTDPTRREQCIRDAVEQGKLGRSAMELLPQQPPSINDAIRALSHVAATNPVLHDRAEAARGTLAFLRDILETRRAQDDLTAMQRREEQRQAMEARRSEVVDAALEALRESASRPHG